MSVLAAVPVLLLSLLMAAASAQDAEGPDDLKIFFDLGSVSIRADQREALDSAARLSQDGNPIVMIISGSADPVGENRLNLRLSVERAENAALALVDRGIPAERLQVLGLGNSDLAVETGDGVAQQENRNATSTRR